MKLKLPHNLPASNEDSATMTRSTQVHVHHQEQVEHCQHHLGATSVAWCAVWSCTLTVLALAP